MTDNEIVKALECCGENSDCEKCPYFKNRHHLCGKSFNTDVLGLINRQKEKNERLQANYLSMQETLSKISLGIEEAKSEAVKEFAEELIFKIVNTPTKFESTYYMYRDGIAFRQNEIIDIIKEMVGDST